MPDTLELRARIAAMLRAGATYAEVRAELGASLNLIADVRREHSIPVPARTRPMRSEADAYAAGAEHTDGGHVRWAGEWAGRCPQVSHHGRQESARRVAFRLAHGREPVGHVIAACGAAWCVAPGHVEDRPMREQLRAQLEAIGGPRA
ncbi:hypothetical protein [Streptomyces sp. C10-9-1]|uniref:hypothetical protein n=1 Tax=Streptomyces sp. C10-9-1 TaxID=1859285 RepID=UPI003F4A0B60